MAAGSRIADRYRKALAFSGVSQCFIIGPHAGGDRVRTMNAIPGWMLRVSSGCWIIRPGG
jgi:hypothetical protein